MGGESVGGYGEAWREDEERGRGEESQRRARKARREEGGGEKTGQQHAQIRPEGEDEPL